MTKTLKFDPALTVNEIAAAHPETIPVFNRFGLDMCCGGGVCVDDAAHREGIDANAVIAALNEAIADE